MVILDRIREIHDDIVFHRYPGIRELAPDLRELAPLIFSEIFMAILATMLGAGLIGGASNGAKTVLRAGIDVPAVGAKLRLSRFSDRPALTSAAVRVRAPEADANDPKSPMLIDIDPESAVVHASAGTIDVHGTPINIGSWPLN